MTGPGGHLLMRTRSSSYPSVLVRLVNLLAVTTRISRPLTVAFLAGLVMISPLAILVANRPSNPIPVLLLMTRNILTALPASVLIPPSLRVQVKVRPSHMYTINLLAALGMTLFCLW